jgi:dTDP-4-dehydrorhamnose reductase
MSLLVTGGSGFLGSKITENAIHKEYTTHSGYYVHKAVHGTAIKFDICDKKVVMKYVDRIKPHVIIHTAAFTDVDRCEKEKNLARRVNVAGTRNIVESCVSWNTFLVYISTDYVFSGEDGMYKETDTPHPVNYYGLTKYKGEKIVAHSSIDWCIVRPSVIFDSTPATRKRNFALWVIHRLLAKKPTKVINDQWVSPVLNDNLSEMILDVVERRRQGIYHLAGATPVTRYDFATLLANVFQLQKELIHPIPSRDMKWRAKRPRNTSLDVSKAMTELDMKPLPIYEAVRKMKDKLDNTPFPSFPSCI